MGTGARWLVWNHHMQRILHYPNLDRRSADVFSVSINIQRTVGFHANLRGGEIVDLLDSKMLSQIHGREDRQQFEL